MNQRAIILLGCLLLSVVLTAASAGKEVDQLYVLSPQWIVLINDYMDAWDARIYSENRKKFDKWLLQQERLEKGRSPRWTDIKKRKKLWREAFGNLLSEWSWMDKTASYKLISKGRTNMPVQAVTWAGVLGARQSPENSRVRDCYPYQLAIYTYLRLPIPLRVGETYRLQQKDGRTSTLDFNPSLIMTPVIKVNQVGYLPDAPHKFAYLGAWVPGMGAVDYSTFKTFEIKRKTDAATVFKGNIELRQADEHCWGNKHDVSYSGEDIYELDFSRFQETGEFYILIQGLGRSYCFHVGKQVMGEPFFVTARGLFHQRCGCSLQSNYTAWVRQACHTAEVYSCRLPGSGGNIWKDAQGRQVKDIRNLDFAIIRETGNKEKARQIRGGWHDAADYDRRQAHHQVVWDLLGTYELNPDAFSDGQLNIPESGNGIPDIVDEAAYGLSVWQSAQNEDGSVGGRIETTSHPHHYGMPDRDTSDFYYSLPTRESTMSFAASAAWLSRVIKPFSETHAAACLQQAERAYAWAVQTNRNPNRIQLNVPVSKKWLAEKKLLTWEENDTNHIFPALLASLNLYRATDQSRYLDDALRLYAPYALRYFRSYPNYLHHSWSLYGLASGQISLVPKSTRNKARKELMTLANERLALMKDKPYRHSWKQAQSRRWGMALPATWARYFILADRLADDPRYRDAALLSADYHLGCNALGLSHTTGLGEAYVCAVQDAETRADNILEPVPGLTPYGVVSVPRHVESEVYSLIELPGVQNAEKGIPLWRQLGPHDRLDPLNNEFTVHETLSPSVVMFGAYLEPGWMPTKALAGRQPKSREELAGWYRLP